MNPSARPKLEAWLGYYYDLGVRFFYLDRYPPAHPASDAVDSPPGGPSSGTGTRSFESAASSDPQPRPLASGVSSRLHPEAAPAARSLPIVSAPSLFEAAERVAGDSLERIREDLGECTRCRLSRHRMKIVFGSGNPQAELVFVGEGPGHDEDVQGLPFVGRAGKLLTQMIEAMGLRREDIYICNVIKCRPPENRLPEKDEIATCSPFLLRQLDVIRPKVIVCLGGVAAQTLLSTHQSISHFRGEWFDYRGARLIATYHPAYLLRNPGAKGEVWKDLQKVMAVLGLSPRRR